MLRRKTGKGGGAGNNTKTLNKTNMPNSNPVCALPNNHASVYLLSPSQS